MFVGTEVMLQFHVASDFLNLSKWLLQKKEKLKKDVFWMNSPENNCEHICCQCLYLQMCL